jgi:hypothetical protein
MRMQPRSSVVFGLAACVLTSAAARADEGSRATTIPLLAEPGEVTNVVDAFDGDNAFDLHLTLGYQYSWKRTHIRRESNIGNAGNPGLSTGDFTASNMNVATYEENTSRLNTRADIGVYHDIALYFRLPIVLSDDRKLTDLDGSQAVQNVVLAGGSADGVPLFGLPFQSPRRGGIEYLAVGLDLGLMNQYRDATKPTWMAGFEVRLSVSEALHACNANPPAGRVSCAYPSDVNQNGVAGDVAGEGTQGGARESGISRGTTGVEIHSFISKRIRYVEPYSGFRALIEFPNSSSDLASHDLVGSIINHPPIEGWLYAGLQIMPFEQREQFQRLTIDGRLGASYRSEGRDYSELFDALGSSSAPSLRSPNPGRFHLDPTNPIQSVADPSSQSAYFNGVTDVSAYMSFQASAQVTWQVGEYIKFVAGGSYTREQSHVITSEEQCDPGIQADVGSAGPCHTGSGSTLGLAGVPNPNYRPTIDAPGRRFKADDTNLWDAWLMGVVMF